MNYSQTGKINNMKPLFFLSLLITLISCGTDQGEAKHYNYTIENKSNQKVDIIPFINGQVDYSAKVSIDINNSFNLQKDDYPPYQGGLVMYGIFLDPKTLGTLTQVEIVFNNNKKIIYNDCKQNGNCSSQPRNIFNPIYSNELNENYTITPEDYQNAIDCGNKNF